MTTPNNQPIPKKKPILTKRSKANQSLPFATWVLLIISFTLLAYAIYTIQTRILQPAIDADNASSPQSSLVQVDSVTQIDR